MTKVSASREIEASRNVVFRAITDIENLPQTNPDIEKVEFLAEIRSGLGAKFRETRRVNGRTDQTELEITEFEQNCRARMVADSHGTVWDSVFLIEPGSVSHRTRLTIEMDARPHQLLPKLLTPLMRGLFRRGLVRHVEAVAAYCESRKS